MAEEFYEAEIFTLTDEEGTDAQFMQLAACELDGSSYRALIPIDEEGNELGDEYIILKNEVDENGEACLVTVDDDEEFDRIADLFEDEFAEIDYDEEETDETPEESPEE